MEKILPKDLAQAYLNYYSKKLDYKPVPSLDNSVDITAFLKDSKIK
jgi:hypothetical protein